MATTFKFSDGTERQSDAVFGPEDIFVTSDRDELMEMASFPGATGELARAELDARWAMGV